MYTFQQRLMVLTYNQNKSFDIYLSFPAIKSKTYLCVYNSFIGFKQIHNFTECAKTHAQMCENVQESGVLVHVYICAKIGNYRGKTQRVICHRGIFHSSPFPLFLSFYFDQPLKKYFPISFVIL